MCEGYCTMLLVNISECWLDVKYRIRHWQYQRESPPKLAVRRYRFKKETRNYDRSDSDLETVVSEDGYY